MSGEQQEERDQSVSDEPPASVDEWVEETADELDLERDTLVRRLLTALWSIEEEDEDLGHLASRVEALEGEFDEKIEDIRERVVQVKVETEGKAPADHAHPDLEGRVDQMGSVAQRAAGQLDAIKETVSDVEERTEAGFDNYEEILEDLIDTTEELDDKLETLAAAVIETRETIDDLREERSDTTAVEELAEAANRHGVAKADCAACGGSVQIALLQKPACPHCAAAFADVDPRSGWFRSSLLLTPDRPAIEDDGEDGDAGAMPGATDPTDDPTEASESLAAIEGLGPTATRRLREAGIDSPGQLAEGDATDLAETTDLPEDRLQRWIDQAATLVDAG